MVRLPVHIRYQQPKKSTTSAIYEARDFNIDAQKLEQFFNNLELKPGEPETFTYGEIAKAVGLTTERVTAMLFRLDAGHTGITVFTPRPEHK